MTDRLLVDLGADGRVSVSTLLDGEISANPAGEAFELVWPLDTDALEDLRWYLEDYLRAPFGVYGERGPQVEGRLTEWGHAVFTALFGVGNYHQLGMVAQLRGRLEDAEQWYRQSLTINEELGNRPGMAMSFGQLGHLAETRGRPEEALEWTVRCVSLFAEFPHPMTGPGPAQLARLTAELGIDTLERCWRRVTGQPLLPRVRDYLASGPAEEATGTEE